MSKNNLPQIIDKVSFDGKYLSSRGTTPKIIEKLDGFIGVPISLFLATGFFAYWMNHGSIMSFFQQVNPVLYILSIILTISSLTLFGIFSWIGMNKLIDPYNKIFASLFKTLSTSKRKQRKKILSEQNILLYTKAGDYRSFDATFDEKIIPIAKNIQDVVFSAEIFRHDPKSGWQELSIRLTKKVRCITTQLDWMEKLVEEKESFKKQVDEKIFLLEEEELATEQAIQARKQQELQLQLEKENAARERVQEQDLIKHILKNS